MQLYKWVVIGLVTTAACSAQCTCYYSADCGPPSTCGNYGSCAGNGKNDGTCSAVGRPRSLDGSTALASALDTFFGRTRWP